MSRFSGDVYFDGSLSARAMNIPANTVDNTDVQTNAGIAATKLQQQRTKTYAQESATTSVSESRVIHTIYGANATMVSFRAGSVVANIGAATITVDLKKNGVSVLSAPISLNSGHTARQMVAGTISTPAGVASDVYEVTIVATAGGGTIGKGVFAELITREDPQ